MINPPQKTYKCVYIKQVRVSQRKCTVSSRDRKKLIQTKLRNPSINLPPPVKKLQNSLRRTKRILKFRFALTEPREQPYKETRKTNLAGHPRGKTPSPSGRVTRFVIATCCEYRLYPTKSTTFPWRPGHSRYTRDFRTVEVVHSQFTKWPRRRRNFHWKGIVSLGGPSIADKRTES